MQTIVKLQILYACLGKICTPCSATIFRMTICDNATCLVSIDKSTYLDMEATGNNILCSYS